MHFSRHSVEVARLRGSSPRGFTAIELMVTVAVAAILLGVAVPSFKNIMLSTTLTSYANSMLAGAVHARGEAIKRNAVVTMCVSTDGANCGTGGWEQGWIVLAGTTVIHAQPAASSGFRITGSVDSVDFQPTEVGTTPATITICREMPSIGEQERVVSISATARASVTKTTNASCP